MAIERREISETVLANFERIAQVEELIKPVSAASRAEMRGMVTVNTIEPVPVDESGSRESSRGLRSRAGGRTLRFAGEIWWQTVSMTKVK